MTSALRWRWLPGSLFGQLMLVLGASSNREVMAFAREKAGAEAVGEDLGGGGGGAGWDWRPCFT